MSEQRAVPAEYEYVVVGSGAGGGTLAARLAEAGRTVVLLEAGGDPRALSGGDPAAPGADRLPDDYDVPAFHPFATENEALKWDFFVRHYASEERQRRDPKYRAAGEGGSGGGVLYPRASALGGCTAHHAMITVYPHDADWDHLAGLTGDPSWSADRMRGYFERLEDCRHRWLWRMLARLGINPTRHGWGGWLQTERSIPPAALADRALVDVLIASAHRAFEETGEPFERVRSLLEGKADPNDRRTMPRGAEGVCYTPLDTRNHRRAGTRERLLDVAQRFPERLRIELDALATEVLFDPDHRAVGVAYQKGARLYRAGGPGRDPGEPRTVRASREVILAGGAFNTPQLLMLSGVGPRSQLLRHGIPVRVDLPGVGRNLQDRYEVGVVNRMSFPTWGILDGARFSRDDPQYRAWAAGRAGVYDSNAAVLGVVKRSSRERALPDLFCFALLGLFKGYFPGYSALFPRHPNYLTWAILKAHTENTAGEVTLRSRDPKDPPQVDFRYFEEGSDARGEDLAAVVAGIRFVRRMTADLERRKLIAEEELPGAHVQSDDDLREFVRDHAWGHHASCTCPIGPVERGGCSPPISRSTGPAGSASWTPRRSRASPGSSSPRRCT